jgi:hypothetical protein
MPPVTLPPIVRECEALRAERDILRRIVRNAYLYTIGKLSPDEERQLGHDLAVYGTTTQPTIHSPTIHNDDEADQTRS